MKYSKAIRCTIVVQFPRGGGHTMPQVPPRKQREGEELWARAFTVVFTGRKRPGRGKKLRIG